MQNKINQSGRSMVEMLGVLAIIGVLSVGGIAGYTMAMNKHKANEILNAASVRAVVVSTKLQTNSGADITNALAEFGNETIAGAVFGAAEPVGTSQFKIKFTTAPNQTICDQMQSIAGTSGVIRSYGTDCDALTYNNDLTNTDPTPSGPSCPAGTSETGEGGYATTAGTGTEAIRCYCETKNTAWNSTDSDCSNATKANTCESFHDCNKGQYCRFSPSSCGDSARGTGTCTTLSDLTPKTYNNETPDDTSDDSTLYLGPEMDWWSAGDFCAAHDKTLVSYDTLSKAPYNCSKSGTCTWSVFNGMGLSNAYWTGEDHGNSCYAWLVLVNRGYFDFDIRDNDYFALCE